MNTEEKGTGKRWPRLVIIILLLLCAALGGVYGTVRYLALGADPEASSVPGPMYELEPFYVNLAGEKGRSILKAVLTLDLASSKVERDMQQYQPVIRDEIIAVLRSKTGVELRDLANYEELKVEIKKRLNGIIPEDGIDAVYFSEFLISQ